MLQYIHFLRDGRNTSEQTADLAAFLIDFKPRPFHSYYKSKLADKSRTTSSYYDNDEIKEDAPDRILKSGMEGIYELENDWKDISSIEQNSVDFDKLKEDLLLLLNNSKTENATSENPSLSIIRDMLVENDNSKGYGDSEIPMMIEYPNGVRIVLKTSNISFISKLLMLK